MNIIDEIKRQLGDVEVIEATKVQNNGNVLKGYSIRKAGDMIAPTLYVAESWSDEMKIRSVVERYRNNDDIARRQAIDAEVTELFSSAENVYDRVYPCLVDAKKNSEFLQDKVWTPYFSLAVIFKCYISCGAITITKDTAQKLGLITDILYEKAVENIGRDYKTALLSDIVPYPQPQDAPTLRILTTSKGYYGAAAILSNKAMEALHDEMGTDEIYMIPSSVHEMIAIPVYRGDTLDTDEIKEMVSAINSTVVNADDVLTDKIYIHRANGQIKEV